MSRLEGQLSPLKQQTRAPRAEATRVPNIPILAGLDVFSLSNFEHLQLQRFAERLLDEVRLWKLREQRRREGAYERA